MLRFICLLLFVALAGCAAGHKELYELPPAGVTATAMPADLSGSWERDYSRGIDANRTLQAMFRGLGPSLQDRNYPGRTGSAMSQRQVQQLIEMAQFTDEITSYDVLTITQDDYEISIEREEDYDMLCSFFDGTAKGVNSPYGEEVCGWDGRQLVSNLALPDGLLIQHRFTISADRDHLRVTTTVANREIRTPFTLERYYRRFTPSESSFNCIETLSMKRVCSTGPITP
jgi:hypothetical protein